MTSLNPEFSLLFLSCGNVHNPVLRKGQTTGERSAVMKPVFTAEGWPHCFLRQQAGGQGLLRPRGGCPIGQGLRAPSKVPQSIPKFLLTTLSFTQFPEFKLCS